MDYNSPTAADYAWSASNDNRDKLTRLEERVRKLEERVEALINWANTTPGTPQENA